MFLYIYSCKIKVGIKIVKVIIYILTCNFIKIGTAYFAYNAYNAVLGPCSEDRFNNDTIFNDAVHLNTSYICAKNSSYKLQGSLSSLYTKQTWVIVNPCNQDFLTSIGSNDTCVTDPNDLNNALADLILNVPVMNTYFDATEFNESPLKTNI